MDNDRIIIGLLIVIVAMLVAGLLMFNPLSAKNPTSIMVTSNGQLYDGDSFTILLTDINQTPIANQKVSVVIYDAGGNPNNQEITTDGSGNGALQLNGLAPGQYMFNVSYDGSDRYSSSAVSQSVSIAQASTSYASQGSSSADSHLITIELDEYDKNIASGSGEYKGEAIKWRGTSIGGLGVSLYKNGQLMNKNDYLSRGYAYVDGQWKWTEWSHGEVDAMYHKYNVGNDVQIQKVEISY